MAERDTDSSAGPTPAGPRPRRRSWLLVTLRRTLFWLALLGALIYAGQLWWLKRGGQPDAMAPPAAPASASAAPAASPASAASVALPAVLPPSAASSAAMPQASSGAAMAPAPVMAPAALEPASAPASRQAKGSETGASAPALPPVTEADIAELAARKLLIPVDGIRPDQLQDTYTQARGANRQHDAIDILAPAGTPVRAVEGGKIVKLFNSAAGGITLYQFDPSGRFGYYYAHLQRYAEGLQEGQEVRRGDVIGYVGSSGNANPAAPHLHFAVFKLGPERNWYRGTYLNPYRLWR